MIVNILITNNTISIWDMNAVFYKQEYILYKRLYDGAMTQRPLWVCREKNNGLLHMSLVLYR